MKKIIFFFILFTGMFLERSFGNTLLPSPTEVTPGYTTIIVNADVTIVLINDPKASIQVMGNSALNRVLNFKISNDTLVINASTRKDLKNAGIIYIPVDAVQKIQVNSNAFVRSVDILNVRDLDILVNGECSFMLMHNGGIHIRGIGQYTVEQTVEKVPPSEYASKKAQLQFHPSF